MSEISLPQNEIPPLFIDVVAYAQEEFLKPKWSVKTLPDGFRYMSGYTDNDVEFANETFLQLQDRTDQLTPTLISLALQSTTADPELAISALRLANCFVNFKRSSIEHDDQVGIKARSQACRSNSLMCLQIAEKAQDDALYIEALYAVTSFAEYADEYVYLLDDDGAEQHTFVDSMIDTIRQKIYMLKDTPQNNPARQDIHHRFTDVMTKRQNRVLPFGMDSYKHPDLALVSMSIERREMTKKYQQYLTENVTMKKLFTEPTYRGKLADVVPGVHIEQFWNGVSVKKLLLALDDMLQTGLLQDLTSRFTKKYGIELTKETASTYADQVVALSEQMIVEQQAKIAGLLSIGRLQQLANDVAVIRKTSAKKHQIRSITAAAEVAGIAIDDIHDVHTPTFAEQFSVSYQSRHDFLTSQVNALNAVSQLKPNRFVVAKRDGKELYYGDLSADCTALALGHSNVDKVIYWAMDPLASQLLLTSDKGVVVAKCAIVVTYDQRQGQNIAIIDSIERVREGSIANIDESLDMVEQWLTNMGVDVFASNHITNDEALSDLLQDRFARLHPVANFSDTHHDAVQDTAYAVGIPNIKQAGNGEYEWQTESIAEYYEATALQRKVAEFDTLLKMETLNDALKQLAKYVRVPDDEHEFNYFMENIKKQYVPGDQLALKRAVNTILYNEDSSPYGLNGNDFPDEFTNLVCTVFIEYAAASNKTGVSAKQSEHNPDLLAVFIK